jgi:hypothetical protein
MLVMLAVLDIQTSNIIGMFEKTESFATRIRMLSLGRMACNVELTPALATRRDESKKNNDNDSKNNSTVKH